MDIIAKAFDLVGLSTEMIGNFLWFVLGLAALGIYTIFKFCRRKFHSDYERGRKRAINKILKELKSRIKNDEAPYGIKGLFTADHIDTLFEDTKEGAEIRSSIAEVIMTDKKDDWKNLANSLRNVATDYKSKHRHDSSDEERIEDALIEFFTTLSEIILEVREGNKADSYKLNGLREAIRKTRFKGWLPEAFSSLPMEKINHLENIKSALTISFNEYFKNQTILYHQLRGPLWWDKLLKSVDSLKIDRNYLKDPFVFGAAIFLQHAPLLSNKKSEEFCGLEKYYSQTTKDEFANHIKECLPTNIDKDTSFIDIDKLWDICNASWNRQHFEQLLRHNNFISALNAALLRLINLATSYPCDNDARNDLQLYLENTITGNLDWKLIPNEVYTLCIASLAKKVSRENKTITIYPFPNIHKEFQYLIEAFKKMLESEIEFINKSVMKFSGARETFLAFVSDFSDIEAKAIEQDKRESSWINKPNPGLLAESGLRILAHIDMATLSSSDIADRFEQGLIAVLGDNTLDSRAKVNSINRLVLIARGLRPQLSRVERIIEMYQEHIKISPKLVGTEGKLADKIVTYLNDVKAHRDEAAQKAQKLLFNLRAENEPLVCFLFGYGGPLGKTIKGLAKMLNDNKNRLIAVTAPLRPVGEGSDLKIAEELKELSPNDSNMNKIVVVADELINYAMKEGIKLENKTIKLKFCLMGCEAYDDRNNVINSAGCRTVAVLAHLAGIPFYVVTESEKLFTSFERLRIAEVDSARFINERYTFSVPEKEDYWPVAEIVESTYIKEIITEQSTTKSS